MTSFNVVYVSVILNHLAAFQSEIPMSRRHTIYFLRVKKKKSYKPLKYFYMSGISVRLNAMQKKKCKQRPIKADDVKSGVWFGRMCVVFF